MNIQTLMLRQLTVFLVLTLFSAAAVHAQPNKVDDKGRKQGQWKKTGPDGKTLYEGTFVDGKPEGRFVYYYPNGKVKIISDFSQKGKISRTRMFHEVNGKLMAVGKYLDEKRDSTWRFYSEDSVLVSEEPYTQGKKNGVVKSYFPNGKVAEEKPYKMDVLDGVWKQYFDDGAMKAQGKYVNGLMEGKVFFYYPDGKTSVAGNYARSLKEGTWTYYKADGKIDRTEVYKSGILQGEQPALLKQEELDKVRSNQEMQQKDKEFQKQMAPRE